MVRASWKDLRWGRRERPCRICGQVNVRYIEDNFWAGWIYSGYCDICAASLDTGKQTTFTRVTATISLIVLFSLHAFTGAAVSLILLTAIQLWRGEFEQLSLWSYLALGAGATFGLVLARRAHRRGELLTVRNKRE